VAWLAYKCNLHCGVNLCTVDVKGRSVNNGSFCVVVNLMMVRI
jgi:hypothetical protein